VLLLIGLVCVTVGVPSGPEGVSVQRLVAAGTGEKPARSRQGCRGQTHSERRIQRGLEARRPPDHQQLPHVLILICNLEVNALSTYVHTYLCIWPLNGWECIRSDVPNALRVRPPYADADVGASMGGGASVKCLLHQGKSAAVQVCENVSVPDKFVWRPCQILQVMHMCCTVN
jgi:hypothetical protein